MLKKLGLIAICATFIIGCTNLSQNGDRLARCKEIKHRIIFNGATNNQLVEAQQNAEMDGLERDYRKLDCN